MPQVYTLEQILFYLMPVFVLFAEGYCLYRFAGPFMTNKRAAELAEVEQKAMDVNASRMNTIADVNNTLNETSKLDHDNKAKKADEKNDDKESEDKAGNTIPEDVAALMPGTASQAEVYRHVDMNL